MRHLGQVVDVMPSSVMWYTNFFRLHLPLAIDLQTKWARTV